MPAMMTPVRVGPSPFARWAERRFPHEASVIDLGCGPGYDAHYFTLLGHEVTAVDRRPSFELDQTAVTVVRADVTDLDDAPGLWDVAYMRWLLHVLRAEQQARVLEWCARNVQMVCIEARSAAGEHPQDHYRRPLDVQELQDRLVELGFRTLRERMEGHGLSVLDGDDPRLLRLVVSR